MSRLDDYVTITITRQQVGQSSPGFGVMMILGYSATWPDRARLYSDLPSMATDGFSTSSPEYLAAAAAFSQTPRPVNVLVGRGALKPTAEYSIAISTAGVGNTYAIAVEGTGVTSTTVSFTGLTDLVFGAVSSDEVTFTAHGMTNGDGPYRVSNSGGALPTGLSANTNYWMIVVDANTIEFATSYANAIADTPVTLSSGGSGTNTLLRSENDVIAAQLVNRLNGVAGANYTAALAGSNGSKTITVTASAAGDWFSLALQSSTLMSSALIHSDPGIATDLTAIALATTGTLSWYALYTTFNSQAMVVAAAAWIEANKRIYLPDVPETVPINNVYAGGSGDTLSALATAAYTRTAPSYHGTPSDMFGAAWLGRMLPTQPGSAIYADKTLAGPLVDTFTETQRANLLSHNANGYESVASLNLTFEGTSADGEYLDAIVGDDWVQNDMQIRIFNVIVGSDKIEYEDTGIARIAAAVRASLAAAVAYKIYAANPKPVVSVPLAASVSSTDKAARTLSVSWTAVRSGAIQKVNVVGTVNLS
jgi:Protein of unknown function (DUF3383)